MPMVSNVGSIVGPILGGLLSDPAANYPQWFGGNKWLERHPYAPPNFLSALFLISAGFWVFFGLDEVSLSVTFWFNILTSRRLTNPMPKEQTMAAKSQIKSSTSSAVFDTNVPSAQAANPPSMEKKNLSCHLQNHQNVSLHGTQTNSPSARSSPTTSSVH